MKKLLLILTYTLTLLYSYTLVHADQREDKIKQIEALEQKVTSLQNQAKTLTGQIAYYDGQISLTALKISQTEDQIASISGKIDILESRLQSRSKLLQLQIVQTYKKGNIDPFMLLFSSTNFSQTVSRFKYLQIVQAANRRFLHDTQLVQSNYAQQKTLIEQAHKKLQQQKTSLASLKVDRQNLLNQTKSSESTYQKQLEQAKLELEAIEKALVSGVKEGPVKAGDPIALMGNSGYPSCSSGPHLHFEVRNTNSWVNAETYLKPVTDKWGLTIGSGNWPWPMKGTIGITQRYGKTDYSYRYVYSGGVHTGIDMVSTDPVIHAVADGTLYSSTQKCGSSTLKIKYIDHGSGLKTLYLHVQ